MCRDSRFGAPKMKKCEYFETFYNFGFFLLFKLKLENKTVTT